MPQMGDVMEPESNSVPGREPDRLEANSALDRTNKTSDGMKWNVELAREWALLGGD